MRIFTEDQLLIQEAAHDFAATEVADATKTGMAIYAQTGTAPFSFGLWDKAAALGYAGITVPEEYGGLGLGEVEELLVMEQLSAFNPAIATNLDGHNLATKTILHSGSEDQRERYLPHLASGEWCAAAAVTDPAGSTNFPEWTIEVTRDGDDYVINGTKHFCSNSQAAQLYAVYTKSEPGTPGPMDCFLVPAGTRGLEMGELESFGRSGTNTGTVELNDVHVPACDKIPPSNLYTANWLACGYLDFAAIMLGRAQGVFDKTLAYVKQRTRRGRPLAQLQAVAHRIANMAMQIEQVRSITFDAAQLWDAGTPNRALHSMAKIAAAEMIGDVSIQCAAMHGAAGSDPAVGIMSALQTAPGAWNGEGPNDLHRDYIADELGITLDSM
ncbi:MAG: acyl-CoA/acyl-ACP dehydrogenase [Bifidobacteriaceae bacterium]|jgi:alkylation response protein AidB-like acyl-CoA dehydrogenase|nr:acyl-CoA/acyl-ACP dehydrogenase [Bifidobacteriaceae bacterium]